ncbi:uncharacterized protein LOC108671132 [Hyalella azteca]|uniref:Uncharacterized protein LOC108671132 n=1 Tax=Hyalella azteca TaxID=294128 RepID=A0A979FX37_HYAAZ|nr:uncharacterized protein LOC108671132 [Hyalella azteca]
MTALTSLASLLSPRRWKLLTRVALALAGLTLLVSVVHEQAGFAGALLSWSASAADAEHSENEAKSCVLLSTADGATELPELYEDVVPDVAASNVYLMETSHAAAVLPRGLCGLESYCKLNPQASVWFLVTAQSLEPPTLAALKALQAAYQNLCVAHVNFTSLFKDTPLLELYHSEKFNNTSHKIHNLSDMSRVALVYKFGGLYSDMDVIALRPLVGATNFIALQDDGTGYLNHAIHRMRRHHPMLLRVMKHVAANYNGQTWAANGPTAMSDVARLLGCDLKPVGLDRLVNATHYRTSQQIQPCNATNPCSNQTEGCDWVALRSNAFMAVHYDAAYKLFLGPEKNETSPPIQTLYPDSLGLHFFNYMTRDKEVQSGSHMHRLASEFCPVVAKKHPLLA